MTAPALRIVLLRPRNAENLGSIARAMSNFGLDDWVTVGGNPSALADRAAAEKLAVGAHGLLERRGAAADLAAATADCHWVVGTTMRQLEGRRRLTPRQLAEQAHERGGRVALVFGDERSGLTNEDLERCHDVSFIPTAGEQPSLNLAQAVLTYAYEWGQASRAQRPSLSSPPRPATAEELTRLEADLVGALRAGGFLRGDQGAIVRRLLAPWVRARLTRAEAQRWMGVLRVLGRPPGGR